MTKKPFSLRLDPELKKGLKRIAKKEDRTVSYIAERAIRKEVLQHKEEAAA